MEDLRYVSELSLCVPESDTVDVSTKVSSFFLSTFVVASKVFRKLLQIVMMVSAHWLAVVM